MRDASYIIISPVRNEAQYLPLTIASVAAQTVRPRCWILVDDGSTDGTGRIVDQAAAQYGWIRSIHRPNRGFRQAGGGVVEAFDDGYKLVRDEPWRFLVKLDGDLSFSADYFEKCFRKFETEARLGIGGGLVCSAADGALEGESKRDPQFHVRGATKIYRNACWNQIGGLIRAPGWDTLDEVKANMLGWATRTFADIQLVHHRPSGHAYGQWSNWIKNGRANYVVGYHPLFMLAKCGRRMLEKPYVLEGFGLWVGFVSGYLKRIPQIEDQEVMRFFRRQQMNRLLGRKSLWG